MLEFIQNVFGSIGEFLNNIKELIFASIDIINVIVSFIPNPFRTITLVFIPMLIGIIIYKVVRS